MTDAFSQWTLRTLGEVCTPVPKAEPGSTGRSRIRYVDIGSVDGQKQVLADVQEIDTESAPSRARQPLRSGDTVFSTVRPYLRKIAYIDESLEGEFASTGFCVLRPGEDLDSRWLFHFATSPSLLDQVLPLQRGVSYPAVRDRDVLSAVIPVPPVDEQRRIVALLEDHLRRLDAANDGLQSAEKLSEALQRRAIVGLLTAEGVQCELSDLLEFSIGGLWGDTPGSSDLDVKVLRVTELGRWGVLDPATAALRSISEKQYSSRSLNQGDLILEKSGGGPTTPVGRVGLVTELDGPSVCSNFMQLMRPDRAKVSPRWLHLYLNAYHLAGRTNGLQKASTNIRNIKASEYLRMKVKVPALSQQEMLIGECESWLLRAGRLQASVSRAGREAAGLRRSLLQTAFSGKLTRESISV